MQTICIPIVNISIAPCVYLWSRLWRRHKSVLKPNVQEYIEVKKDTTNRNCHYVEHNWLTV